MEAKEYGVGDSGELASRATRKVHNRVDGEEGDEEMLPAQDASQPRSWKDRLLGTILGSGGRPLTGHNFEGDDDFELLESDIEKATINGTPTIYFSNQINQFLVNGMAHTVVIKLLGRTIGYTALYNKVCAIWKPKQGFQLIDVENGYFLAKFQNKEDFERALCDGPWIVYGQYLTVQPWTVDFDTRHAYPSLVMAWVHFLSLLGHMYRKRNLMGDRGFVRKGCQTRSQHREWRKRKVRPYGYLYQFGQSFNFPSNGEREDPKNRVRTPSNGLFFLWAL